MVKFDCCTEGLAGELANFLKGCGWRIAVRGAAVFTDCPSLYAGCYCNAMIKIGVPNAGDLNVELS